MKNSILIAIREWKERMGSRSFILLSLLGPCIILCFIYLLFAFGGSSKQHWNVLIVDPGGYNPDIVLFVRGRILFLIKLSQYFLSKPCTNSFGSKVGDDTSETISPL